MTSVVSWIGHQDDLYNRRSGGLEEDVVCGVWG